MSVTYQAPGLSSRNETFVAQRHESWQTGYRSTDIAVLRRDAGPLAWANENRRFRLYDGATKEGTDLHIYGYGAS